MSVDAIVGAVGLYLGTFAIGALGSIVPVVSIEVFLVAVTLARGPSDAAALVVLAALGQLLGKLPVYFGSRAVTELPGRHQRWVERVRGWNRRIGNRSYVLLGASAVLGIPPFSIASTAAGALAIPLHAFCLVIALGRALRFAVLVAVTS